MISMNVFATAPVSWLAGAILVVGLAKSVSIAQEAPTGGQLVETDAVAGLDQVAPQDPVRIRILSNRADLISGGDALVAIELPPPVRSAAVRVRLNGVDVSNSFTPGGQGSWVGLVTGLKVGRNTLVASLHDGHGAQIVITNHPSGGPLFSGPQIQPWMCQSGAVDASCNQPATYSYLYLQVGGSSLVPYDPTNPANDVATTTTDQGLRLPFIVRQEIGYQDRNQYTILTLFDPNASQPWTALTPQRQWNHKVLITHGGGCGSQYGVSDAILHDQFPLGSNSYIFALGRGFAVMSTALDNAGADCNLVLQAESLIMAREHLIENYGLVRYAIGIGCSGGSYAQQHTANAYPGGIYQGLIVACSFPDTWSGSSKTAAIDLDLLNRYFADPATGGWSQAQINAVQGEPGNPLGPVDPTVGNSPISDCIAANLRYDPLTNPAGIRCTTADWSVTELGRRPFAVWTAQERAIGHGFAGVPLGNAGVQYGLEALEAGVISIDQFLDLNARIGSMDIDYVHIPGARRHADQPALARVYRTGLLNDARHMDTVAIINGLGPSQPVGGHPSLNAYAMRARLDRQHHTHANQVIWGGPLTLTGDVNFWTNAIVAMDRWLAAVEVDGSARPLAEKIIRDKPADIFDACFDGNGNMVSPGKCPASVLPVYALTRTVAGESVALDINECQLVPPQRADYGVQFNAQQWQQLEQIFSEGVCDYSKPGISQLPTIPWLTYQDGDGEAIVGGSPLGPPPVSTPIGAAR